MPQAIRIFWAFVAAVGVYVLSGFVISLIPVLHQRPVGLGSIQTTNPIGLLLAIVAGVYRYRHK